MESPAAGMMFHFQNFVSAKSYIPCEAAGLATRGEISENIPNPATALRVRILVSPTNLAGMKEAYAKFGDNVEVIELYLRPKDLNIVTIHKLMCFEDTASPPLYLRTVETILRKLAKTNKDFTYKDFQKEIRREVFNQEQKHFLQARIKILESFLGPDTNPDALEAEPGMLTIVDLSGPYMSEDLACTLFGVCLSRYLESSTVEQKVIAMDEAHTFLKSTSPSGKEFTNSIINCIRKQRHYGCRVVVSTQEPTLRPELLQLSSIFIMHRFDDVGWLDYIQKYKKFSDKHLMKGTTHLETIRSLDIGECCVYCPTAVSVYNTNDGFDVLRNTGDELKIMKTRARLTMDAGMTKTKIDKAKQI